MILNGSYKFFKPIICQPKNISHATERGTAQDLLQELFNRITQKWDLEHKIMSCKSSLWQDKHVDSHFLSQFLNSVPLSDEIVLQKKNLPKAILLIIS